MRIETDAVSERLGDGMSNSVFSHRAGGLEVTPQTQVGGPIMREQKTEGSLQGRGSD